MDYNGKKGRITMAIKSKRENSKLILEVDNGDLEKLDQCMERWSFKDHQSMLRFAMSILLVTEDQSIWIKSGGKQDAIAPIRDLLK